VRSRCARALRVHIRPPCVPLRAAGSYLTAHQPVRVAAEHAERVHSMNVCVCHPPSTRAHAAEQSSSEGVLLEDVFAFQDVPGKLSNGTASSVSGGGAGGGGNIDTAAPNVRLVFGCEKSESGEIFRQVADGIMGMGNNDNSLQSQVCAAAVPACVAAQGSRGRGGGGADVVPATLLQQYVVVTIRDDECCCMCTLTFTIAACETRRDRGHLCAVLWLPYRRHDVTR
jgi:hypothetical protein